MITLNNKKKTYIIAEVGINHNGNFFNCKKLIKVAANAGADAVKFQNWEAEDFISDKKQIFTYKSKGKNKKESFYDLCKRNELKKNWISPLNNYCKKLGIDFLSTPTTKKGVDELKKVKVKYIKNGSDYITNLELIKYMAKKFKNIILSTGMSYLQDIELAVNAIKSLRRKNKIIILHCTSLYPTIGNNINLRRMVSIKKKFNTIVGFSDHTLGSQSAVQAVSMGAEFLEKHITLDHNMEGPDHWFSLDPVELKEYVSSVRKAEISLGSQLIQPARDEIKIAKEQRLSVVSKINIKKGEKLTLDNIEFKKPGTGINPNRISLYLGKRLKKNIIKNTILKSNFLK